MALLSCKRCGATAEGKDFDEADAKIDHAVGLSKGWPCTGNPDNLVWSGEKTAKPAETPKPKPVKKSK